jgi:CheY-specific phosphatase CheX
MFSQYFGNYLLTKGIITLEQLKDVMHIQKSVHVKIGILAVNSGLLTATQVEEIHNLQTRMDKRFGELAVEKGYINIDQLEGILSVQQNAYLMLGQALMDRDYMTLSEVETALNNYKKDYSLNDIQLKEIQMGDIDRIIETFISFNGIKEAKAYKEYIALFTRNLIRFIDEDVRIESLDIGTRYRANYMLLQSITGEINLLTGIDAKEEAFLGLASKYAGESITKMDELAIDSFGEFLNLQNGIFTVNKSNEGTELTLTPQHLLEFKDTPELVDGLGVTFFLPYGEINLIISTSKF